MKLQNKLNSYEEGAINNAPQKSAGNLQKLTLGVIAALGSLGVMTDLACSPHTLRVDNPTKIEISSPKTKIVEANNLIKIFEGKVERLKEFLKNPKAEQDQKNIAQNNIDECLRLIGECKAIVVYYQDILDKEKEAKEKAEKEETAKQAKEKAEKEKAEKEKAAIKAKEKADKEEEARKAKELTEQEKTKAENQSPKGASNEDRDAVKKLKTEKTK